MDARRSSEDTTHAHEQSLGRILENSLNEIYVFHPESLRFIWVNGGARVNLGYSLEELQEMTAAAIKTEIDSAEFDALVEPLRSGTESRVVLETVHRRRDGSHYPVEAHLQLLEYMGEPALVAMVLDTSEQKKLEEDQKRLLMQLEYQKRILDDAQRITHMGSWVWNIQDGSLAWSDEIYRIFGLEPQEFGATYEAFLSYIHPEDRDAVTSAVQNSVERRAPYGVDHRVVQPNGTLRYVREQGEVTYDPSTGAPLLMVGTVHDITDARKQSQERERLIGELEARNAEMERFTYTVSHDLKSPLITIRGFLGLLQKDALAGDEVRVAKDVAMITSATDQMQRLLDELLELSRIGRIVNAEESIDLNELVSDAADLVAGRLEAAGAEVRIAPDLPMVFGDRRRIQEVFQNLLDNAAKFLGDREGPVIEIGSSGDADGRPILFVKDNGIGIDPAYHEKVFGLFERLDQSIEGTGIGLAMVRRIIELHGGRIWVESEGPGTGSTFRFHLPEAPPEPVRESRSA
ncbi:MAG: ATP-binding protein [Gemmatimonadota bacterium]|nr:ATP-binding protein [Gemmatimonadota bacterium]